MVTYLKSASEASYDVTNMATIMRNCSLIKAMVCVGMVIFIQHERFFNIISIILVILLRYRMAGITESAMVAYTHKYAVV